MKCPVCNQLNKKSRVLVGNSTATLVGWLPYYDEDGNFHNDDPNTYTTNYSCTNGHEFTESIVMKNLKITVYKPKDFVLKEKLNK